MQDVFRVERLNVESIEVGPLVPDRNHFDSFTIQPIVNLTGFIT